MFYRWLIKAPIIFTHLATSLKWPNVLIGGLAPTRPVRWVLSKNCTNNLYTYEATPGTTSQCYTFILSVMGTNSCVLHWMFFCHPMNRWDRYSFNQFEENQLRITVARKSYSSQTSLSSLIFYNNQIISV